MFYQNLLFDKQTPVQNVLISIYLTLLKYLTNWISDYLWDEMVLFSFKLLKVSNFEPALGVVSEFIILII